MRNQKIEKYMQAGWKKMKEKQINNKSLFHEQVKIYNNVVKQARNAYFASIISSHKNNPKVLFSTIDHLINPDFNTVVQQPNLQEFAVHLRSKIDFIRSSISSDQKTVFN